MQRNLSTTGNVLPLACRGFSLIDAWFFSSLNKFPEMHIISYEFVNFKEVSLSFQIWKVESFSLIPFEKVTPYYLLPKMKEMLTIG